MYNDSISATLKIPLALAFLVFGHAFSRPAVACLCNCSIFSSWGRGSTDAEITPAEYDHVFSGLVIATERIERVAEEGSTEGVSEDPGYWIKSRILVLRIWRGAPPTVAEVWTPVASSCDTQPITGLYFVALVRSDEGRNVAPSSYCDCDEKAAATQGRGAYAMVGMAIIAAGICAVAVALISLQKVFRRRRQSAQ